MGLLSDNLTPIMRDLRWGAINNPAFPRALRSRAWKALGLNVHTSAVINPGVFLGASSNLSVGARTFINYRCFFDLGAPTVIGDDCAIGYEVLFCTSSHEVGPHSRRAGDGMAAPITVGNGVWIGARATILPGVTIGDGCVIAAGAVVAHDCAPDGLYGGVPAVRLRELS